MFINIIEMQLHLKIHDLCLNFRLKIHVYENVNISVDCKNRNIFMYYFPELCLNIFKLFISVQSIIIRVVSRYLIIIIMYYLETKCQLFSNDQEIRN